MFPLLCIFSEGNWHNLSEWALTRACGWPNFRSTVRRASWYIVPQFANSAITLFALPATCVFKYISLTSSVGDAETMALLNWSKHSWHWTGSPLYWDHFHLARWSFVAAANSCAMPWSVRFAGATGAAWPIVGINGGALKPNGLRWHEVVVFPVEYSAVWEDCY